MSKAIQIHIPEPCHENWHNMTPQEQGRFCGSCQKIVVDFSVMSDKEVLDYISKSSQHTCGRFANDQLIREIKGAEHKRRISWAYIWNLLLATFLVTESYAQGQPTVKGKPVIRTKPVIKNKPVKKDKPIVVPDCSPTMGTIAFVQPDDPPPPREISGIVLDDKTNEPIPFTSVIIKGGKGVMVDSMGKFNIPIGTEDSVTLTISCIGYTTQTLVLNSNTNWQNIKVLMTEEYYNVTTGLIVVGYKVPKKEKLKRTVNNWVPTAFKKDIKVYPNPVVPGNTIHAIVSLKQTGSYKLELIDVQGRVVEVQKLLMNQKEQQVSIPTQTGWSTGIYWIRITAPGIKNVYQAKVSIQ